MKGEKFLSGLTAWFLAVAAAMGGLACMTSGLKLESADIFSVLLVCAIFTAICCVFARFRRGGLVFLCLCVFLGSYLYREGTLPLQVESLVYKISQVYDRGYGWGVIRWSGLYLGDVPITQGLCLAACLISGVTAWALCRQKRLLLPLLLCLLPLFSCMVVTDSVPGVIPLLCLLIPVLLMVITNTVRRRSRADGIRLTAILLIPVLLASILLFAAVPQTDYEMQMTGLQQTMLSWFRGLPFVTESPDGFLFLSFDGTAEDEMNLSRIGPKTRLYYAVMDVVSDRSDVLYLRGQSFDSYNGTSWIASDYSEGQQWISSYWPDKTQLTPAGTVSISVRGYRSFRYMPYYPTGTDWMFQIHQGKLDNPDRLKSYSFDRAIFNSNPYTTTKAPFLSHYLALPNRTLAAALDYLEQSRANGWTVQEDLAAPVTSEVIANAIGRLVESSATYSLNTGRMPENEQDFAMWFLQNSETGYCVHFATAATVLLRAMDIPARYVTGYTCQSIAGKRVTVTADKAHAWVEYFDKEKDCWRILDPTPASEGSGGGGADRPTFTTPTVPPVTTAPAEPTQPTETEPVQTLPTDPVFTLPDPSSPNPTEPPATQSATEPTGGLPGPGPGGSGGTDLKKLWETLKPFAVFLAWCLGAAGILAGQYWLRRRLRNRNMHTGHPNKRAIARWRETCRMAALLKVDPPDKLEQLAEKAKFSQHTLTADELMEFDSWIEKACQSIDRRHWSIRFLIKLIWAV